jgi:hypothetical protein
MRVEGVMPDWLDLLEFDLEATQLPGYHPFVLIFECKVSV